ncbi:MAG: hypothetical protein JW704_06475 [Anaerolineaceae bacterium]|nr:hypothetical protein [Anaerolineaceae bacterium]
MVSLTAADVPQTHRNKHFKTAFVQSMPGKMLMLYPIKVQVISGDLSGL